MSQAAKTPPPDAETLRDRMTLPGPGWTRAEQGTFTLPPEPDADTEPTLHALWVQMLQEPLVIVPPDIDESDKTMDDGKAPKKLRRTPDGSSLGSGHVMESRNWSGALVAPGRPQRLRAIGGAWAMPAVQSDPTSKALDGIWRCSTWVGLDGHFTFALSLPQLGTECSVDADGVQTNRAWFQWWAPNTNTRPHYLKNFPVAIGNRVACYLWATAADEVGLLFRRLDKPDVPVVGLRLRGQLLPDKTRARVYGTTGEWIVERPTKLGSRKLYPLPRFDPIDFDFASAGARGPCGPGEARDSLTGARLIRMYEPVEQPPYDGISILGARHLSNAKRRETNQVVVRRVR